MWGPLLIFILWLIKLSSPARFSLSLDGIWKFKISPSSSPNAGFDEQWWLNNFERDPDSIDMPVPSSFNDITTDPLIRDYVGWVWYQRHINLPKGVNFNQMIVTIHFGAVEHFTTVWIEGVFVGAHLGGHIPFELDVTKSLSNSSSEATRVTIAVNNTLNDHSIPQGFLEHNEDKDRYSYTVYNHAFDYFDYAGLNGKIRVDFKPFVHVEKVDIRPVLLGSELTTAEVNIYPKFANLLEQINCILLIKDPQQSVIVDTTIDCYASDVQLYITQPVLWWPRSTFEGKQPGLMYTVEIILKYQEKHLDVFRQTFGIRQLEINGTNILMNNKQLYIKGFGMHQDAEIRGRGFDPVTLVRDFNLLKWTEANAIRTSHYPYFEDFIEMADRNGIMIILETPACSLSVFDETLLKRHQEVLSEMRQTFKNNPSIIMWSLANEPLSNDGNSTEYFKELATFVRSFNMNILITFVTSQQIANEKAIQNVDVVCLNRYQGWYSLGGRLDLVQHHVIAEIEEWQSVYQKPIILTEFGAEALSGYHSLPSTMWTENYQVELFHEHYKAFDILRQENILSGEMVWNFADFKVPQEYFRAEFCHKGIFTRNRQPKAAAYTTKLRYQNLKEKVEEEHSVEIVS